jgi:hypothetical protein
MSVLRNLALSVALIALVAAPSVAHELGLTRVTVTFASDATVQADVLVDPESLLAKLEILAGQSPTLNVPLDELPARITALEAVVQQRTRLLFDGERIPLAFTYIPGPPVALSSPGMPAGTAATATMRLVGRVPRGARTFQMNYGLVLGSYALSLVTPSGQQAATVWLAGGQDSQPFDLRAGLVEPTTLETMRQYFVLGFEHILPKGVDHILFVLGLFLLSASWRPLLLQVTMFTVAHSLTLGLSMYGLVTLPSAVVEPLIALSITYVAIENLFTSELKPWRAALVFAFGLLHGLGFAGVLGELGLPRSQFVPALVTFNVGVEAGQLTVIGLAFAAVGWWRRAEGASYRRWVVVPVSLAIALVGAYWTIIRVNG